MINRIKRILKSKLVDDIKKNKQEREGNQYTFMLTKDGIAKSVTVYALSHIEAEKELIAAYPEHKVQFLWEWK